MGSFATHRDLLQHKKNLDIDEEDGIIYDYQTNQFLPLARARDGYNAGLNVPCPWGDNITNGVRTTTVCLAVVAPHLQDILNTPSNSRQPHLVFTVAHPQTPCRHKPDRVGPVSHTYEGIVNDSNPMGGSARVKQ